MNINDELEDILTQLTYDKNEEDRSHLVWRARTIIESDEWKPIETAPKDGTEILMWSQYDGIVVGHYSKSVWADGWIIYDARSDTIELHPTHWMPLPQPPTA